MADFDSRKAHIVAALAAQINDRSPKGCVDAPIFDLVALINQSADYYTTSSCSGRITIFLDSSGATKGGEWLLISHDPVAWPALRTVALNTFPSRLRQAAAAVLGQAASDLTDAQVAAACGFATATLRFEPFILAIECRHLEAASALVRRSAAAGCRESGIATIDKRIMVSVRCSIRLEVRRARSCPVAGGRGWAVRGRWADPLLCCARCHCGMRRRARWAFSRRSRTCTTSGKWPLTSST